MLRRGGALSALLRHGSPRGMRGETTKPEPRKWSAGPSSHLPLAPTGPITTVSRQPECRMFAPAGGAVALPARRGANLALFDFLRRLFGARLSARETPPGQPQSSRPAAPSSRGHATGTRPATRPEACEARATGRGQRTTDRDERDEHRAAHRSRQPRQQPHQGLQRPRSPSPRPPRRLGAIDARAPHAPAQPAAPVPIAQLKRAAAVTQRPVTQPKPAPAAPPQPVAAPTPAPAASRQPAIGAAPAPAASQQVPSGPAPAPTVSRPEARTCAYGPGHAQANASAVGCQRAASSRGARAHAADALQRSGRAPLVLVDHAHARPAAARARDRRGPARALRAAPLAHRGGHRPGAGDRRAGPCGTFRCTARAIAPATTSPSRSPSAPAASG